MAKIVLKYIGSSFIPNVPARDLSQQDIKACPLTEQELVDSGLYQKPAVKKASKKVE